MTVAAATIHFRLYPGATFTGSLQLLDPNDEPIDLTGCSALMHIRREIYDATPILTLTTADGSIVLGGVTGTIDLALPPDAATSLPISWDGESWVHDLLMTQTMASPAFVERTFQGTVAVLPGVTRT